MITRPKKTMSWMEQMDTNGPSYIFLFKIPKRYLVKIKPHPGWNKCWTSKSSRDIWDSARGPPRPEAALGQRPAPRPARSCAEPGASIYGCFPCYRSYLMYGLSLSWSQPEVFNVTGCCREAIAKNFPSYSYDIPIKYHDVPL